uniref:G domain-containing protein n=1 Tax=Hanusia phi TaxID=3032 RepID=A0A7S0DY68_9CRYP|mmetsp:Transcript_1179/g.2548  ORF Transcript_1179/g.2548 Transcript_1179/m.2548 type:complete len:144 (+) Transcript_1179:110-541(+)
MTENKINIFLRIRPTKKQLSNYEIIDEGQGLVIDIPKENQAVEVINNTKERHEFRFNKVFDREARQEEIFQDVAPRLPEICIAGRTNSGKSSLINHLLAKPGIARTSSRAGKTDEINLYMVNSSLILADFPVYTLLAPSCGRF